MTQMWFPLSILALTMLAVRRSSEKIVSKQISSLALAWMQQAVALPFIIGTLFFARFYWPSQLSTHFWTTMAIYVTLSGLDLYCYFKALSIADISYVAPLMSLLAIGNITGAYFVLGQKPSLFGVLGGLLIVAGVYLVNKGKQNDHQNMENNKLALLLVLFIVCIRGYYSNIEVSMLRESNPVSFNFYSSVLVVPLLLIISLLLLGHKREAHQQYWQGINAGTRKHIRALSVVGVTYTISLLATYQAKLLSPNAGYVGAVRNTSVLPIMIVGALVFKEKVYRIQWYGLGLIMLGLVTLGLGS